MNLRIVSVTIGTLLCICCIGRGVRATSRSGGSVITTGRMTVARFDHAAVLLRSGRVLVVGGIERNGVMQPSAELFDPATGQFTATGEPQAHHGWGVTATLLPDGKVLVAGGSSGCDSPCYTASAELYDPSTTRFASTGKMTIPRAENPRSASENRRGAFCRRHSHTESSPLLTAELYQPSTGTFTLIGATHLPDAAQIVLLNDGRALVIGNSGTDLFDCLRSVSWQPAQ